MLPFTEGYNSESAIQALLQRKPVVLRYPGMVDSGFNFISGFLYRLLSRLDIAFLTELILVLLKEITSNSSKANAKRIYFDLNKLNIRDQEDYKRAVQQFSGEVLARWDEFLKEHARGKYYISLTITLEAETLAFTIENNSEIVGREWERIRARFESFKKYKDIERAFSEIRDSSEGAGLGIVMTLLLLQNAGISPDHYNIKSADGLTHTTIRIPTHLTPDHVQTKVKEEIQSGIDELPTFPENITNLIQLCNSDTVNVQVIADKIQKDPGLTAQVLKLVNSAGYMNRFRNPTLADSVKIIGLKVLRNLLMVSGARTTINDRYRHRELEQIWEESNKVSFIARGLARGKVGVAETVTLAGLLFQMGKIILLSLNPSLVKKIHDLMGSRRLRNSSVLEEIAVGISHPEIGALMAKKWKFPEALIAALRYQQKPLEAPAEYEETVRTVYLAIKLHEAQIDRSDYYSVEPDILEAFGIGSVIQFEEKVQNMASLYQNAGSPY